MHGCIPPGRCHFRISCPVSAAPPDQLPRVSRSAVAPATVRPPGPGDRSAPSAASTATAARRPTAARRTAPARRAAPAAAAASAGAGPTTAPTPPRPCARPAARLGADGAHHHQNHEHDADRDDNPHGDHPRLSVPRSGDPRFLRAVGMPAPGPGQSGVEQLQRFGLHTPRHQALRATAPRPCPACASAPSPSPPPASVIPNRVHSYGRDPADRRSRQPCAVPPRHGGCWSWMP